MRKATDKRVGIPWSTTATISRTTRKKDGKHGSYFTSLLCASSQNNGYSATTKDPPRRVVHACSVSRQSRDLSTTSSIVVYDEVRPT